MLDPDEEDTTIAQLPTLPCQQCHRHPMALPHSICAHCVEVRRLARVKGET